MGWRKGNLNENTRKLAKSSWRPRWVGFDDYISKWSSFCFSINISHQSNHEKLFLERFHNSVFSQCYINRDKAPSSWSQLKKKFKAKKRSCTLIRLRVCFLLMNESSKRHREKRNEKKMSKNGLFLDLDHIYSQPARTEMCLWGFNIYWRVTVQQRKHL